MIIPRKIKLQVVIEASLYFSLNTRVFPYEITCVSAIKYCSDFVEIFYNIICAVTQNIYFNDRLSDCFLELCFCGQNCLFKKIKLSKLKLYKYIHFSFNIQFVLEKKHND